MTTPLHAKFYADRAVQQRVRVELNEPLARDTYRLRMHCPQIAERIVPGQFVMLRLANCDDPLLARALALYDTVVGDDGRPWGIDVVYLVVGKLTSRLATCELGTELDLWGPLGNGFSTEAADHLLMVAGGIGQTPFVALAAEALGRRSYGVPPRQMRPIDTVTLCYGARSASLFAGIEDFEKLGVDVRLSTDDGTAGHHGLVTDLVASLLGDLQGNVRIACCGPEPMLEAVADLAAEAGVACEVSLETPMACGIGICFSCVAKVAQPDGGWDYKRTCVEGPVFPAEQIVW